MPPTRPSRARQSGLRVGVTIELDGKATERVRAALAAIEPKLARRATRAAIDEVTKLVLKDAKALAPRRSGRLRTVLGRKVKTYRQSVVVGIVGPRRNMWVVIGGVKVDPSKYAHLVEFGRGVVRAGQRTVVSGGRRRVVATGSKVLSSYYTAVAPDVARVFGPQVGPAAPRPFLGPAWEQNRRRASAILGRHLQQALARAAGKGAAFGAAIGRAGDVDAGD